MVAIGNPLLFLVISRGHHREPFVNYQAILVTDQSLLKFEKLPGALALDSQ
jgi:hypothetical protein